MDLSYHYLGLRNSVLKLYFILDNWICQRCRYIILNKSSYKNTSCYFCTKITGVTKYLIERDPVLAKKQKKYLTDVWGHINCIDWHDEIWFWQKYILN